MAQVNLDVVYKVKGLQALRQSQTAINNASKAAGTGSNNIRRYNQALTASGTAGATAATGSAKAARGIRATGFAATTASGGVKSFGVALSAALGPVAAVTGALAALGSSLKIFADRQQDAAVLEQSLDNLGVNGGKSVQILIDQADKLGKQTLFDQEEFTKGFKLLTSFRTIGVDSYQRVATAAADMSTKLGTDLNSSLLQLAKALEAPEVGLTALQRSGTRFTEEQKEMIKALVEAGRTLDAQKLILAEIEKQYGGAAKEAGGAGLAGAMDSAGEASRDLAEGIGRILTPAVEGFLIALTPVVQKLADFVELAGKIPGVSGGIKGAAGGLAGAMQDAGDKTEYAGIKVEELYLAYQSLGQLNNGEPLQLKDFVLDTEKAIQNLKTIATQTQQTQTQAQTRIRQEFQLKQAILNKEKEINGMQMQQAKAAFDAAKNAKDRETALKAINQIYELNVQRAELEYQSTLLTAEAELSKLRAAQEYAGVLLQQIEAEVALQRSKGVTNQYQDEAIAAAQRAYQAADEAVTNQEKINDQIKEGARARLEMNKNAAATLRTQQQQELQQKRTNSAIKNGSTAMQGTAAETGKAYAKVIRFNDGLKKSVVPAQQVAKAAKATQTSYSKSVTHHPPVSRELKVQRGLQFDISKLLIGMLKTKLDLYDTDEQTRAAIQEQHDSLKNQLPQLRQNAYVSGYNRDLQHEIGNEIQRNITGIQQMVAGLWNGASAAGAMADNLARASAINGGGSKKSVKTTNANGVSNMRHNGGLFVPSYLIQDYGDGRGNGMQISTEKFGNVSWDEYKYLAENPTHGLKHYEQHKKQQREEQKRIQYEIQHGPGSYESSFSKTSSRYKEMQKSQNSNVNVNYTGSTLSFNGGEYVQKGDVKGIVNSAVGATLKTLSSSSSARLRSGMR